MGSRSSNPSTKVEAVGAGVHVGDPQAGHECIDPSTCIGPDSIMLPPPGKEAAAHSDCNLAICPGELYPGERVARHAGYRSIGCIRAGLHQRSDVKTQSQARGYLEMPWGS